MTGKAIIIAVLAVFLMTSTSWAFGEGGRGNRSKRSRRSSSARSAEKRNGNPRQRHGDSELRVPEIRWREPCDLLYGYIGSQRHRGQRHEKPGDRARAERRENLRIYGDGFQFRGDGAGLATFQLRDPRSE